MRSRQRPRDLAAEAAEEVLLHRGLEFDQRLRAEMMA